MGKKKRAKKVEAIAVTNLIEYRNMVARQAIIRLASISNIPIDPSQEDCDQFAGIRHETNELASSIRALDHMIAHFGYVPPPICLPEDIFS